MKMKKDYVLLFIVIILTIGSVVGDRIYVANFQKEFKKIEQKRIETSNKLNTAKIVYEDLTHVRDLVFKNMDIPGKKDTASHETVFFDFVTECVNDLKMELLSVSPERPKKNGRVTTYGYKIVVQGDFFSFGELCSKFENSRRIISLEHYSVDLILDNKKNKTNLVKTTSGHKGIQVTMYVNTYRVEKRAHQI
ncbi:MAG: type 4a pilus biogenesis protein PilO [Fibrobacteria bacterium]|nr:type 4a pilus biogenesis protein PilO [Fibrobacteria bacterium]